MAGHKATENEGARTASGRKVVLSALVWLGVLLAAPLGLALAVMLQLVDTALAFELAERSNGVILGTLLSFYGMDLPKILTPQSMAARVSGKTLTYRRFAGWSYTIGGLAYAASWIVVPLDLTLPVAMGIVIVAAGPAATYCLWLLFTNGRNES